MAIVQNPLIGRAKKSLANATFTTWKGRNVVKGKPISVANPQSPAQVAQRTRFKGCVQFYAKNRSALSPSMWRLAGNVTDSNRWSILNQGLFRTDVLGIDPSNVPDLTLSTGDLDALSLENPMSYAAGVLTVPLVTVANAMKALDTDLIRVVVVDTDEQICDFAEVTRLNVNSPVDVTLTAPVAPTFKHIFAYSYAVNSKNTGKSVYLGTLRTV